MHPGSTNRHARHIVHYLYIKKGRRKKKGRKEEEKEEKVKK